MILEKIPAEMLVAGSLAVGSFLTKVFSSKQSEAEQIRKELREDVKRLEKRIDDLGEEVHFWRTKYYETYEELLKSRLPVAVSDSLEPVK